MITKNISFKAIIRKILDNALLVEHIPFNLDSELYLQNFKILFVLYSNYNILDILGDKICFSDLKNNDLILITHRGMIIEFNPPEITDVVSIIRF
ncbi:MAG: hypothetical protein FWF57_09965 [Defluviitaleaceae bacterium]|nr:hypothetical protein [Defluviitaleaceae bacterium]